MWNNVNGRDRKVSSYLSGDLVFYFSPKIMLILSRLRVSKKLKPFFFQGANLLSIFRDTLLFLDIHKVTLSVTKNIELFDVFLFFYLIRCLQPIKVGLSASKNIYVICLTESPLKIMKNAFYFILKALLVLKISKYF